MIIDYNEFWEKLQKKNSKVVHIHKLLDPSEKFFENFFLLTVQRLQTRGGPKYALTLQIQRNFTVSTAATVKK